MCFNSLHLFWRDVRSNQSCVTTLGQAVTTHTHCCHHPHAQTCHCCSHCWCYKLPLATLVITTHSLLPPSSSSNLPLLVLHWCYYDATLVIKLAQTCHYVQTLVLTNHTHSLLPPSSCSSLPLLVLQWCYIGAKTCHCWCHIGVHNPHSHCCRHPAPQTCHCWCYIGAKTCSNLPLQHWWS